MSAPENTIMAPADANSIGNQPTIQNMSNNTNIYSMDMNYANQNKWFAYFPLEDVLGKNYQNLNLHIQRFSIPQLEQTSQTVTYRGYEKEIPSKVLNPGTKQLTIDYIVDQNWYNYTALYSWMSGIDGVINPIATDAVSVEDTISPSDYVPLRIYLLGPYKKKIIQFKFSNTWIKVFNEISLDVNAPGEVVHSFTLAFDEYSIDRLEQ